MSHINFFEGLGFDIQILLDELTEPQRRGFAQMKAEFGHALSSHRDFESGKMQEGGTKGGKEPRARGTYEAPDDFTLLRFLQADKYDVDKALARMANCVLWRERRQLSSVLASPPPCLGRYTRARVLRAVGVDKEGRPLLMERLAGFCNA